MSVMKWTLALAGTAMSLRYLSERRRKRTALVGSTTSGSNYAGSGLMDRDSGAADDPWSVAQRSKRGTGAATVGRTDELPSHESGSEPGSSGDRF